MSDTAESVGTGAPSALKVSLGSLVVEFSLFEFLLTIGCTRLITPESSLDSMRASILLAGLSASTLLDKYCALYRLQAFGDSEKLEALEKFRIRATALIEQRNGFIHGLWAEPEGGPVMHYRATAKAKAGLDVSLKQIHPSEIDAVSEEAIALSNQLGDFLTTGSI